MRRLGAIAITLFVLCAAPAAWGQMHMVTWSDPLEGAFSLQVPQGWKVQGGLRRMGSVDVRPDVLVSSGDGRILCRIGDAFIQPMVVPNQMLSRHPFGEGRPYSPGYGQVFLILRYLPGAHFLTKYYIPRRVGQVQNLRAANMPVLAGATAQAMARMGLQVREDAGVATFNIQTRQGPRVGWVFCQTRIMTMAGAAGMANWWVRNFYAYLADPAVETQARRVLGAMVKSFKLNPQWVARQAGTAGRTSQIVVSTDQQTNQIIQSVIANRMAASDKAAEEWSRYIRGTSLRRDPNTGQIHEVDNPRGTQHYRDRYGRIIPADRVDPNTALLEGYQKMEPVR